MDPTATWMWTSITEQIMKPIGSDKNQTFASRRKTRRGVVTYIIQMVIAITSWSEIHAQPALDNLLFTAGTTYYEAAKSRHWAYLLWQSRNPQTLGGRAYAIYQKNGKPDSPSDYKRTSVVTLQTDSSSINA